MLVGLAIGGYGLTQALFTNSMVYVRDKIRPKTDQLFVIDVRLGQFKSPAFARYHVWGSDWSVFCKGAGAIAGPSNGLAGD